MDSSDAIQFIVLIILLFLSGFFSSAETALTTVSKITMRSMADDGDKRAALVLDVIENQKTKMLSAILIGNNIVNISASSLATTLAYSFGGYMVRIIHFLMTILTPFIFIVNLFSRGILVLLRINPDEANKAMTEDELRTIVDVSHEDGVIESEEKEMIYNVFDLGDAKAKDVMVPRVHVTFADVNNTYAELIDIYKEDKFTRLPVYEDTTDNVIGTINMKDLLLFDDREHF